MRIITLTTDFGISDPYVASMKGAILSRISDIHLVDVTHNIPAQDVLAGQMVLADIRPYFPKGTVHLAVVDPGVGTERLPIIVDYDDTYFVGPDNGLFTFLLTSDSLRFWRIDVDRLEGKKSATFEGRDVFAPVAALLAMGKTPAELGMPIEKIEQHELPSPSLAGNQIHGEVISIDHFGNIITNISSVLAKEIQGPIEIGGEEISGGIQRSYGYVAHAHPIALWNSSGWLEIAVRNGSAAERLNVERGTKVYCKGVKA